VVGYNQYATVSNCYARGNVTGTYAAGGLVGNNTSGTINKCYSTGQAFAYVYAGGLVGLNSQGSTASSFWDTQTSGKTVSEGGTGKTTAQMKDVATFTNIANPWDFMGNPYNDTGNEDIWAIYSGFNNGYPNLSHQTEVLTLDSPLPTISLNATDNSVVIAWDAVPSAASYILYWSADPVAAFPSGWTQLSVISSQQTLSYTDSIRNTGRFYRLLASTQAP